MNTRVEGIVQLILERLAFGEAPFTAEIRDGHLVYGARRFSLDADTAAVETFVRDAFHLPLERPTWKDIRKQTVRNYLLHKFSDSPRALLQIHLNKSLVVTLREDAFEIDAIK